MPSRHERETQRREERRAEIEALCPPADIASGRWRVYFDRAGFARLRITRYNGERSGRGTSGGQTPG